MRAVAVQAIFYDIGMFITKRATFFRMALQTCFLDAVLHQVLAGKIPVRIMTVDAEHPSFLQGMMARQGKLRLGVSTIYQLMRRLEGRGLVESRWQSTNQGPPRAYYDATEAGRMVVWRYINEVLSPASPIPAALGKLIAYLTGIERDRPIDAS